MNKQVKQLLQLANQCVEIAKENQFLQGTRNDFNNENVSIGIYTNDNFKTMAIYFSPVNEWKKEIEISFYSGMIKIPYHLTVSDINALIVLYTEFVNNYLGINKQETIEKLNEQKQQRINTLKDELEMLISNGLKDELEMLISEK